LRHEFDQKRSQLRRLSRLFGTLRQRCSQCVSTLKSGVPYVAVLWNMLRERFARTSALKRRIDYSPQQREYPTKTSWVLGRSFSVRVPVDRIASAIKASGKRAFLLFRERQGAPLGRKNVQRFVMATLLALLVGAGLTVWSKVFRTGRQIYIPNPSPKEQSAQTPPASTNPETTTTHRQQAAVNKDTPEPTERLEKPQATQGGILEQLFGVFSSSESTRAEANPHARVWVDAHTGVYLCQGTRGFGRTRHGRYMTQQQARFDGFRPAYDKKCE